MQIKQDSNFVSYELTDHEHENGCVLNYLQRGVIQNQRVEVMEQLVGLTPSVMTQDGKESYWQQEAYLRGQLDILTHLLERSTTIENHHKQIADQA